jgi:Ser/Thr protein kinase RdoA (MazF antagonist)
LRRQVIYNDLNFHNVLVDPQDPDRIAGIIDFGDIIAAPLINDLAVAASYQLGGEAGRAQAAEFIAAYHRALPLRDEEIRLLPLLIEARLAMTLLITGYRARLHPQNAAYILRNNASARAALLASRAATAQSNLDWIMTALEDSR